jgi:hypothetical protein
MSVSVGKPANWLLNMMKNPVFPLLVLVLISACATSTDKEYIRCLQGFNDPSTGSGIPVGKAASVMAAVTAGMLWYYQWPLFLSPVGGFIVLGVMLLLWNDS